MTARQGEPAGGARALLICHPSTAESGVAALKRLEQALRLDVLSYGAAAGSLSPLLDANVLSLPGGGRRARAIGMIRLIRHLRSAGYRFAAVAQPNLQVSRARGPLLAFPFIAASKVMTIDVARDEIRRVSMATAMLDLMQWGLLQIASAATAFGVTEIVERAVPEAGSKRAFPATEGAVVYLRTDIDLKGKTLEAGGSLAHSLGVLDALLSAGHSVHLWSTGRMAGVPERVPVSGLPAVQRANLPTEIAELVSGLLQIAKLWRSHSADAFIYQRYSLNNLAGLVLARRWGVPLVLEANASEVAWRREWGSLRFRGLSEACERLLLRAADRVVVVSSNAEQDLLIAGADHDRIRVVPNGVDVDRFAGAMPRDLGVGDEALTIGFCGLFYRWHGVPTLARAFCLLAERVPEARLLLIGKGDEEPLVDAVLQQAGLSSRVLRPGLVSRDDVPGYLAAADILVSPHADVDGFIGSPIKVFEYMATGKAIVASDVAQIGDVLEDGRTALLVPPGDPGALANALERLLNDPELRERLGEEAQRTARNQHTWGARLREILDVE